MICGSRPASCWTPTSTRSGRSCGTGCTHGPRRNWLPPRRSWCGRDRWSSPDSRSAAVRTGPTAAAAAAPVPARCRAHFRTNCSPSPPVGQRAADRRPGVKRGTTRTHSCRDQDQVQRVCRLKYRPSVHPAESVVCWTELEFCHYSTSTRLYLGQPTWRCAPAS